MAQKRGMQYDAAEPDLFGGHIVLPAAVLQSAAMAVETTGTPKTDQAFKSISETADMLSLPQHVLRFWESKFAQVKPLKLRGGRRYYRPQDIEALFAIKHLLYKEGYTIKGARRAFTQSKKRKPKEDVMAEKNAPRKSKLKARPVDDAPLFGSLIEPAHATPAVAKKEELKRIHHELLELRQILSSLPPLTVA